MKLRWFRTLLASLGCLSVLVPNCLVFAETGNVTLNVGDVNFDEKVNALDVLLLKKHTLGIRNLDVETIEIPIKSLEGIDSSYTANYNTELDYLRNYSIPSTIDYTNNGTYSYSYTYDYVMKEIADIDNDGHLEMAVKYYADVEATYQVNVLWVIYSANGTKVTKSDKYITCPVTEEKSGVIYDKYDDTYKFVVYNAYQVSYVSQYDINTFAVSTPMSSASYVYDAFGRYLDYDQEQYYVGSTKVTLMEFDERMRYVYESLIDGNGAYYLHDGVIEVL